MFKYLIFGLGLGSDHVKVTAGFKWQAEVVSFYYLDAFGKPETGNYLRERTSSSSFLFNSYSENTVFMTEHYQTQGKRATAKKKHIISGFEAGTCIFGPGKLEVVRVKSKILEGFPRIPA